jgi:PAS domain S-box-containing protein
MKIPLEISPQVSWDDILKRFLLIFLPLALLFGSITLFIYFKDVKAERLSIERNEVFNIETQLKIVASDFDAVSMDLKFLAAQNELSDFLQNRTPERLHPLVNEWLSFCTIKSAYGKIRYIDKTGRELIKITCINGKPEPAPPDSLQNDSDKDYFRRTIALGRHDVYISPFDLSRTAEDDQEPFQPVLRFSMPVFDAAGQEQGILVLNYRGTLLINELKKASANSPGSTILVNEDFYYLTSRGQDKQWEFTSSGTGSQSLKKRLPTGWHRISREDSGQFRTDDGLITFGTIYPLLSDIQPPVQTGINIIQARNKQYFWKTVSYVPIKVLAIWPIKILNRIFLLYSVCLFIIAICSLLLARTSAKRKSAEETIREREEHLRAINSAAANAIIVIDNNKRVLHWNPAAEKLFQYTYEEVMDKPITAIIAPPKHQSTFTKISKKFNIPEKDISGSKTIELFGYKKDGTEFPVEVSFSAFKSRDQWHTVGIIRDISTRKKMEKEVLRAQKFESLGVLASGIAHDFNNLLTAIIGNINLVCRLTNPKDENYELLESAEKAAMRAKSLSQQLLIFSKRGNPIRKTTSIAPLIKDSADFALHGSTVSCSIKIPEDLWQVDIDTGQMSQVIQSLIINGKEAISGSGTIEISCCNVTDIDLPTFPASIIGNFIQIQIHDTGCGISKRDIPKIFDPYYSTKTNGRGLGLAIVYSIIQKHDGHITVQSEPDIGTTVSIFLPASLDQHRQVDEKDETLPDRHYQIMVVDGEEMLLNIARRMLIHLGHECICVKNSMEAIEIYKHLWKTGTPVDGVIVDLTIPGGMGGKETAGAIYDINPEARIIVSSGYTNDPVMIDFDEYGFCAAIAKPFDMTELRDILNSVIG